MPVSIKKAPTLVNKIESEHQRVGVFVDAQNMYHTAKNLYHAKVNFKKILEESVGARKLIRAFVYVIKTETGEEAAFVEALEKSGYEIKIKDLQIFSSGAKKADWDVGMAIDAVILADKIDVAVIVSGDGDMIPLVEYLKINKGLKVEAMSFGRSTSGKLKEVVDVFHDLETDVKKFLMYS
ncbi:MAG: NYN domain-containing protein [Patescibacteria group bacterium]